MLRTLRVKNFAIVEELVFEPKTRFTVLTGETGAGKSIIVNALHLLLGGKPATNIVREGCEQARIEGTWQIDKKHPAVKSLENINIEQNPDGELLIARTISPEGKSRFFINEVAVTQSFIRSLSANLLNISGQHEHISLLDPQKHLDLLDAFGNLNDLRTTVSSKWHHFSALTKKFNELTQNENERISRIEFLKFQLEEIKKINPKIGEEEELVAERSRLRNVERLAMLVSEADVCLSNREDGDVLALLGRAHSSLQQAVQYDPSLANSLKTVEEALSNIQDASTDIVKYLSKLEDDPKRLEQIESRLFALSRLFKKFGGSCNALLEKQKAMEEELSSIDIDKEALEQLCQEVQKSKEDYEKAAHAISSARKKAAVNLVKDINTELFNLGFQNDPFSLSFSKTAPSETGDDVVEFLFSPNIGETPKPLSAIASGGELSRFFLGVKLVLARVDDASTYVFDEVDAGIGGSIGEKIGTALKKLASTKQVLCITHLATVAAQADYQIRISKEIKNERTYSMLTLLSKEEREKEIARMLAGDIESKVALTHAREILSKPSRGKR